MRAVSESVFYLRRWPKNHQPSKKRSNAAGHSSHAQPRNAVRNYWRTGHWTSGKASADATGST